MTLRRNKYAELEHVKIKMCMPCVVFVYYECTLILVVV